MPLLLVENAIWHSPRQLWTALHTYESAADMKRMLMVERGGCPELLALGTSLSDRTITGRHMDGKRMERDFRVQYSFDFAVGHMRPEGMLAQWRWLQERGCTPRYVVVELSPVVLNENGALKAHDPPLMDLLTFAAMPDGFAQSRGYDYAAVAQLLTYDRLLSFRRRKELVRWAGQRLGMLEEVQRIAYPSDGQLRRVPTRRMGSVSLAKEGRKQRRRARRGKFKHGTGRVQLAAMDMLTDAINATDARLIFHTPPVLPLYRDEIERQGGMAGWCAVVRTYRERPGIEWFNQYGATDYSNRLFSDWVHLNRRGARLYARNFRLAVFHRRYPHDGYCD